MMKVLVCGALPKGLSSSVVTATVAATFRQAKRTARGSLSVQFVTEAKIAKLNGAYRGKHRSTDVLSFSSTEGDFPGASSKEYEWGDIFVCPAYAKREARRRSISLVEELLRLVSHGTLHLLGYDHANERDEMKMFALQESAVESAMRRV
ncbi:MAG: rRNA maturation RNase YbeY [Patescibacteria group bacterium]|jgi:probable rRNA maturation factor